MGDTMRIVPQGALAILLLASAAAFAQATFDGTYSGALAVKTDNHQGRTPCAFIDPSRTLTIQGGKFAFVYYPTANVVLNGSVQSNGSLTASGTSPLGGVSMKGSIQGGVLTADVTTTYCVFSLTMKK
jgi:hypothetical protein